MANQYTKISYSNEEINEIINLYKNGMSFTKIGKELNRQKNRIKEILIDRNVWIENRDINKQEFSIIEINKINTLYQSGLSIKKISDKLNIGVSSTKRILKDGGILRSGTSNGTKLILTEKEENKIKELYLKNYSSIGEISNETGLTESFIDKYLTRCGYRRDRRLGNSIGAVKKYGNMNYNEYLLKLPEYVKYKRVVISITNKQQLDTLSNYNKRGISGIDGAYHLDHKYSITEGFRNNIKPEIIGNINNLEFIPWEENLAKKNKCSITITQLLKTI